METLVPIYEYRCPTCGKETEKLQKMSEPPPKCPDDEKHGDMQKKVSVTSFRLEGGGWGSDGYGS